MKRKTCYCHSCSEVQTFIKPDDRQYFMCAVCGKVVTEKNTVNKFKEWGLV